MSIPVSALANSQTFGTWENKTNQIAAIISSNTVTVDSTAGGSLTSGNAVVNGFFGVANLIVSGNLSGGSLTTPANLNISSNLLISNSTVTLWSLLANSTTTGLAFNTNTITLSTNTLILGNAQFSNSILMGTALANSTMLTWPAANISGNVSIGGSLTVAGNIVSSGFALGDIIPPSDNLYKVGNLTFRYASGWVVNFSSNLVTIGNSTVNATVNSTIYTATSNNSTNFAGQGQAFYANVSAPVITTTVNVGSNVSVNTSTLLIGNSTVNTTVNSTIFTGQALTSNNSTNFGGHAVAFFANVTSYPGAFNGTSVSATWGNFSGQVNASAGVVSIGVGDNGGSGGQFRLIDSNYGVILRNDDTSFFIMSTASANSTGTWNTFRPFAYNLSTGAVTLDSTGIGVTFGGSINMSNTGAQINVGSNVSVNVTSFFMGNSTINTTINSSSWILNASTGRQFIANASFFTVLNPSNGNQNQQSAGSLTFGNTTGTPLTIGIATATANQFGTILNGNATVNSTSNSSTLNFIDPSNTFTVNSSQLSVGANVTVNTSTIILGTTVVNASTLSIGTTVVNSTVITLGNSTVNSVINSTGMIISNGYINSSNIKTTAITANYNLAASDVDSILVATNATSMSIAVPNTLPTNFRCMVTRVSSNVNLSNNAGVTLNSRTGNYNILNRYGSISIFAVNNSTVIIDGNI